MQKRKQEISKERRKKERKSLAAFFADMDEGTVRILKKVGGLVMGALAVFTFLALMSYLFTWKADYSLLSDPDMLDRDVKVGNLAGKLGYRWALFLCSGCFGLGSFAIVYLFGSLAWRMLSDKPGRGWLRTVAVSLAGAFVFSLILAFFSDVFGCRTAFGGGLGGDCGEVVVSGLVNLTGSIVTFIILLIFMVLWLLSASGKFSAWLSSPVTRRRKDISDGDEMPSPETSGSESEEPVSTNFSPSKR